jgi:hypothetical protein
LLASQPWLSRRTALRLLGVSALATVAGCRPSKKSDDGAASAVGSPSTSSSSSVSVASSQALARRVADDERTLIAAYDEAMRAAPDLEPVLAPLRADHAAHLVGLTPGAPTGPAGPAGSAAGTSATPTPTPSAAGAATGSSAVKPPSSPAQSLRAQTLSTLAARERTAAAARVDDLMSAEGSLARVLASIGGCEAAHAALLAVAS